MEKLSFQKNSSRIAMKKILINSLKILIVGYLAICVALYFFQESFIFHPSPLKQDFDFNFKANTEVLELQTPDGETLSAAHFKVEQSKGLIFYLHGNAGNIYNWSTVVPVYNDLGYDVFLIDYRGFGKSTGSIDSEDQFFGDMQMAYDRMKSQYAENEIVVLGYSIGTSPASWLAANNTPQQLILQAPHYNLKFMMSELFPIFPTFLLKYPMLNNENVAQCKMPVTLLHGNMDSTIPIKSSEMLAQELKPEDSFIVIEGLGHNGMTRHPQYLKEIKQLLH